MHRLENKARLELLPAIRAWATTQHGFVAERRYADGVNVRPGDKCMQIEQLSAGHGALTAVRTGQGRDMVVLHSLLADRHAFDPVLPALAAKHRVTLINLPGFHGSQPTMLALMDAYVAAHRGRLPGIRHRQ